MSSFNRYIINCSLFNYSINKRSLWGKVDKSWATSNHKYLWCIDVVKCSIFLCLTVDELVNGHNMQNICNMFCLSRNTKEMFNSPTPNNGTNMMSCCCQMFHFLKFDSWWACRWAEHHWLYVCLNRNTIELLFIQLIRGHSRSYHSKPNWI